jgi:aerobic-type carbon monoxide dehydrogenase small subunit (CoxS/CutS family)
VQHDGAELATAAGLASGENPHPTQRAFIEHDAFQCGYCTPGQIVSALGMLREAAEGWPSSSAPVGSTSRTSRRHVPSESRGRAARGWAASAAAPPSSAPRGLVWSPTLPTLPFR